LGVIFHKPGKSEDDLGGQVYVEDQEILSLTSPIREADVGVGIVGDRPARRERAIEKGNIKRRKKRFKKMRARISKFGSNEIFVSAVSGVSEKEGSETESSKRQEGEREEAQIRDEEEVKEKGIWETHSRLSRSPLLPESPGVSLVTRVGFKSVDCVAGHGRPVGGIPARGLLTWFTASPVGILMLVTARVLAFIRWAEWAEDPKVFVGRAVEAKPFVSVTLLFFA
jgi:hypothetical protein